MLDEGTGNVEVTVTPDEEVAFRLEKLLSVIVASPVRSLKLFLYSMPAASIVARELLSALTAFVLLVCVSLLLKTAEYPLPNAQFPVSLNEVAVE